MTPRFAALLAGAVAVAATLPALACDDGVRHEPTTATTPVGRTTPDPASSAAPDPEPESARSTMLFVGTTFWGRYVEDRARASRVGVRHPFSRLREFERREYDAWIGGLECPTVPGLDVDSAEQDRLLSFNCETDFLPEAARWFTAFSLANNHTENHGRAGVEETRAQLTRHGLQHFGDPDPRRVGRACNVVAVPVRVRRVDGSRVGGRLPVAMCGLDSVFRIPPPAAVAVVEEHARHLPTFALPHGGLEYTSVPDSIKIELARDLVDAGADAVLGDHPHWIQRAETWRGRLIVHSMGNFMFDQQGDAERTRSAAIRVELDTGRSHDLAAWLELGEICAELHGACLDEIREADLPKPIRTMRFGVVGTSNAGGLTHRADPALQQEIRDRLRWDAVGPGLRPPYSVR